MPAAAPWIAAAVAASTATYQGIEANQQAQHAKGAAQAQETIVNSQIDKANALDMAKQKGVAEGAAASASADANSVANKLFAKKRTLAGGSSTPNSAILSDPIGGGAPTITKTLLGA